MGEAAEAALAGGAGEYSGRGAARAAAPAGDVQLVAVSSTHDTQAIRPLIAAGQRHFGENRVQEAAAEWPDLRSETRDIVLHLIGQLLSNKAEEAVRAVRCGPFGRSQLDGPGHVPRPAKRRGKRPQLFIQVTIGDEEQKGGCATGLPALLAGKKKAKRTRALRSTA